MIRRAEHAYGSHAGVPPAFAVEHFVISQRRMLGEDAEPRPEPSGTAVGKATVALARVNHGRWIVDCPFCPSAALVTPDDPRFFCVECGNAAAHGRWAKVIFPDDVDAIEQTLEPRPAALQNWEPGEDVDALRVENDERLAETPDPGSVEIVGRPAPRGIL